MPPKQRAHVNYTGLKEAIDKVRGDEEWLNAATAKKIRYIVREYLMLMGLLPAQAPEDLSKYHYSKGNNID